MKQQENRTTSTKQPSNTNHCLAAICGLRYRFKSIGATSTKQPSNTNHCLAAICGLRYRFKSIGASFICNSKRPITKVHELYLYLRYNMVRAASETTVLLLSFKQCKSSIAQAEQPHLDFFKSPLLFPCIVLQIHVGAASFKF